MAAKRKCSICGHRYQAKRADSRYCSSACRQRAFRMRADDEERLQLEIDEAARHYWGLVAKLAVTRGESRGKVLSGRLSQFVDGEGNVYIRGRLAGRGTPNQPGFAAWGLEAAGPPWCPPSSYYADWITGRKRV